MGKFDEMSKYILDNIGGVGNITNVTHCATRLRIEVAKPSLVDVEALKKAPEQAGLVEKGCRNRLHSLYMELKADSF